MGIFGCSTNSRRWCAIPAIQRMCSYDVTPDDQRFVMIRNLGAEEATELIVVENFFEELKAKVGN